VKTKPTQHSVGRLREIGILPDVLICRTEKKIEKDIRRKIALFCNVPVEAVIEEKDVDYTIYEVPLVLRNQGLDDLILKHLGLPRGQLDLSAWEAMVDVIRSPRHETEVSLVGKYVELTDAYKSIYEALTHAGVAHQARVRCRRIAAEDVERHGPERYLRDARGILVPGGFGDRGIEGKIAAIRYAREHRIPFFGLCLGMQCACIEFARDVLGLKQAHSTEFNPNTPDPVISLLETQRGVVQMGGTMRLGAYPCRLASGSVAAQAYGRELVHERHRHRYEFNNAYRERFEAAGARFSGLSPDGQLVEIFELPDQPWFVSCQFHPEFQSKPVSPHQLFRAFVRASLDVERGGST
jgi:CTP synthase